MPKSLKRCAWRDERSSQATTAPMLSGWALSPSWFSPESASQLQTSSTALCRSIPIEEARDSRRRLLELEPGLTIARYKASPSPPHTSPDILAIWVEGLRKAGLPEE